MSTYKKLPLALNSGTSVPVTHCQNCGENDFYSILFLGFLPPVNKLRKLGTTPQEEPSYPAQLLYCNKCSLAQLGLIVDPEILFPKTYPYTSGTTKVLRDNFAELYRESSKFLNLQKNDLIIDIGSNDGTLLSNFINNHRVLGITPEDIGKNAIKKGIPTLQAYFSKNTALEVKKKYGKARVITAANVFAHMEQIHDVIEGILLLLEKNGVFISESHYLLPLLQTVQYDTIYHEHMRYYSLISLKNLLESHGLEVFHAKEIPSHGGSIRVYAARKGVFKTHSTVRSMLVKEKTYVANQKAFVEFSQKTLISKLALSSLLLKIKKLNKKIFAISAPSRGSTLINYTGLDEKIIDCIVEVKGSYKIGHFAPGTLIPILDEQLLFKDQPDYALLLSWHIAAELMPKLKQKGFKGDFIVPLPYPKIILNKKIKI